MTLYPRSWLEIDLTALTHNLSLVRETFHDPKTLLALVLKADAYGHGMIPIARHGLMNGADWCAVATVQEGVALRDAGIVAPILILSATLPSEAEQAIFYDLRLIIERFEIAQALNREAIVQQRKAAVHIKVDTGLSRYGCLPEEVIDLYKSITTLENIKIEGISTHFVDSSTDPKRTLQQIELFQNTIKKCANNSIHFEIAHAANSAATSRYLESQQNLVRIAAAAYGIDAFGAYKEHPRPVMCWKTRVLSLRERPANSTISYNATHTLKRTTKLATIGAGYGDGYRRSLSNRGIVWIRNREAPILGLVCMDQMVVDVTDIPGVEIGDEVELLGNNIPAERLARLASDSPNAREIPLHIMSRVPRRYNWE